MLSLRYIVFILLTLCFREAARDQQIFGPDRWLLPVLAATLGSGLLMKMVAFRTLLREKASGRYPRLTTHLEIDQYRRHIEWAWCCLMPLLMFISGYLCWSSNLQQFGLPKAAGMVVCFLPAIFLALLAEVSAAQVDQLIAASPSLDGVRAGWLAHFYTRVRLGDTAGLFLFLLPLLLLSTLSSSGHLLTKYSGPYGYWTVSRELYKFLGVLVFSTLMLMIPHLMTLWSRGKPLPAKQKRRVDNLRTAVKLWSLNSALIPSHGRWAGAAVVGWIPGFRKLWIGDGLISRLNDRQLDMVFLHEFAHLKRFHFAWRMLPIIVSSAFAATVWQSAENLAGEYSRTYQLTVILVTCAALIVGLGWIARRCELDADRTACDLAQEIVEWVEDQSPADVLSETLSRLLPDNESQKASWLHPSLEQRRKALADWAMHNEVP
jgi:Zn-dependent protease with chaperone function